MLPRQFVARVEGATRGHILREYFLFSRLGNQINCDERIWARKDEIKLILTIT